MAFNGNLHEFGIVSLLQLPATNRLTGRLHVNGPEREADFFYDRGKLVHAVCGHLQGRDVLALAINWDEGRFSFETEATSAVQTIKEDLHHTLMWAVKERDEKRRREEEAREAEEARRRETSPPEPEPEPPEVEPFILPGELLSAAVHASYACIVSAKGVVVAETSAEEEFRETVSGYLRAIRSFIVDYPGEVVGKTFIDDQEFSLALAGNPRGFTVVLFAAPGTRLGILSMELGRFITTLEGLELEEEYEGRGS